jgi:hypothetical protein
LAKASVCWIYGLADEAQGDVDCVKRTAEMIEESKERAADKRVRTPTYAPIRRTNYVRNPKGSPQNLVAPWPKGVSGNPGGRPKNDVGREIARAVLEGNREAAYEALARALLKGNAYVFKELTDRAYGKVSDKMELTGKDGSPLEFREMTPQDVDARIKQLERELGYANEIDLAGRVGRAQARAAKKSIALKAK